MTGGKLPALNHTQACALFERFAPGCDIDGMLVSGIGRHGTFTVHMNHGGGLRSDQLRKALTYLGVSRDEFWEWHGGR